MMHGAAGGPREVLCFTDSAIVGGAERAMMMLLGGLDRDAWTPVLVHHDHAGLAPLIRMADAAGVARWTVPVMPEGASGAAVAMRFARRIRERRPAVFHAHLSWPLACKWPLLAACAARVPAVLGTFHLFVDIPIGVSRRVQARTLATAVGRFIAVSEDTRRDVLAAFGWPGDAVAVIHNAVDLGRFGGAPDPALRARLDDGSGRAIALVPARLDEQKGHVHLVEAARRLQDVRFICAGEGPLREELEARVRAFGLADRVVFLGQREDVPELLDACDLMVLPSLYEGLPLSLAEAMAAGRPIVATDAGGSREIVTSGETGLLVPPGDAGALAEAVRRVVAEPELAARFVAAGRARAAARFSAEGMVEAVCSVYRELIDA